jgi:hypothetical protein
MSYSRINSASLAIWGGGGGIHQFSYDKNWKKTLVWGTIMEKLTQIHQIPKIPNLNFLNDKFQWVTK